MKKVGKTSRLVLLMVLMPLLTTFVACVGAGAQISFTRSAGSVEGATDTGAAGEDPVVSSVDEQSLVPPISVGGSGAVVASSQNFRTYGSVSYASQQGASGGRYRQISMVQAKAKGVLQ